MDMQAWRQYGLIPQENWTYFRLGLCNKEHVVDAHRPRMQFNDLMRVIESNAAAMRIPTSQHSHSTLQGGAAEVNPYVLLTLGSQVVFE